MARYVVGDLHGGFRALQQVLERASFDKDNDLLIGIGDYADGWPEVYELIDYLSLLPNFTGVIGNHDEWLLEYLKTAAIPWDWLMNGGNSSIRSYKDLVDDEVRARHISFLSSLPYSLEIDGKLFVHGGVRYNDLGVSLFEDNIDTVWDRLFFEHVANSLYGEANIDPYKEIYIGHTTTQIMLDSTVDPVVKGNVYLIDQGGGWSGKLTLIDIDSKETWQSDYVYELYPEVKGRG